MVNLTLYVRCVNVALLCDCLHSAVVVMGLFFQVGVYNIVCAACSTGNMIHLTLSVRRCLITSQPSDFSVFFFFLKVVFQSHQSSLCAGNRRTTGLLYCDPQCIMCSSGSTIAGIFGTCKLYLVSLLAMISVYRLHKAPTYSIQSTQSA